MGLDLQSEKEMKWKVLIKNHIALHPKTEEEREGEICLVVKCIKSDENNRGLYMQTFQEVILNGMKTTGVFEHENPRN